MSTEIISYFISSFIELNFKFGATYGRWWGWRCVSGRLPASCGPGTSRRRNRFPCGCGRRGGRRGHRPAGEFARLPSMTTTWTNCWNCWWRWRPRCSNCWNWWWTRRRGTTQSRGSGSRRPSIATSPDRDGEPSRPTDAQWSAEVYPLKK